MMNDTSYAARCWRSDDRVRDRVRVRRASYGRQSCRVLRKYPYPDNYPKDDTSYAARCWRSDAADSATALRFDHQFDHQPKATSPQRTAAAKSHIRPTTHLLPNAASMHPCLCPPKWITAWQEPVSVRTVLYIGTGPPQERS